jgi:hypothetical protein
VRRFTAVTSHHHHRLCHFPSARQCPSLRSSRSSQRQRSRRDHCCCSVSHTVSLRHDAMPRLQCRSRGQSMWTSGAVLLRVLLSVLSSEDMSVPFRHHGRVGTELAQSTGARSGFSASSTGTSARRASRGGRSEPATGTLCSIRSGCWGTATSTRRRARCSGSSSGSSRRVSAGHRRHVQCPAGAAASRHGCAASRQSGGASQE